jgi:hypothetical protein
VFTGIETANVEQLPIVTATTMCPACGRVHSWTRVEAWLAEGGDCYRTAAAGASELPLRPNGSPL